MDDWKLIQYNKKVDTFLDSCSSNMEVVLKARLGMLLEQGNACREPISRHLKEGLFELRAKADGKQIRLIYFFMPQKTICFVHAFIKKTRQISLHDIKVAKKK